MIRPFSQSRFPFYSAATLLLLLLVGACAKGESNFAEQTQDEGNVAELGYIPVNGTVLLGTQCPYGSIPTPEPVLSALWDCESSGLSSLDLTQSPSPLLFQADCTKRMLTVRMQERGIDLTWQVLPDGRFVIPVDKLIPLSVQDDGTGMGPCVTETKLVISGTLNCAQQDRPSIQLDPVWYLNAPIDPLPQPSPSGSPSPAPTPSPSVSVSPSPTPSPSASPAPTESPAPSPSLLVSAALNGALRLDAGVARRCQFEATCLLHAPHRLQQCQ